MSEIPKTVIQDKALAEEMAYGELPDRELASMAQKLDLEDEAPEHIREALEAGVSAGQKYIDVVEPGEHKDALQANLDVGNTPDLNHAEKADESHEQIKDLHELVSDFVTLSEDEFSARYGTGKTEFKVSFREYRKQVEQNQLWEEAKALNGIVEQLNAEAGLYTITLPTGEKMFGSIYSILDSHPELAQMSTYAELIRSAAKKEVTSTMAETTAETPNFNSVIVASGSFAQPEINPHPADYDFAEHLDVFAEDMDEASAILKSIIAETIARTNQTDNNVEFSELKLGVYPDDAPAELAGKSIKWSAEDVEAGVKTYVGVDGETQSISLDTAFNNPGMFKFDWLVLTDDGQIKEMTKVVNLRVIRKDGTFVHNDRGIGSAFQELYFHDISEAGLTEELRDPEAVLDFLHFLRRDIKKYGAADSEKPNALKAAKRAYNLLKITGDFEGARDIAKELFASPAADIAARAETISLLPDYMRTMEVRSGEVDVDKIASGIEKLHEIAVQNGALFGDRLGDFEANMTKIQTALRNRDKAAIEKLAPELFDTCIKVVDTYTKKVLADNTYFNELIS